MLPIGRNFFASKASIRDRLIVFSAGKQKQRRLHSKKQTRCRWRLRKRNVRRRDNARLHAAGRSRRASRSLMDENTNLGSSLSQAIADSVDQQFRFASYFSHLVRDSEARRRWKSYAESKLDLNKALLQAPSSVSTAFNVTFFRGGLVIDVDGAEIYAQNVTAYSSFAQGANISGRVMPA